MYSKKFRADSDQIGIFYEFLNVLKNLVNWTMGHNYFIKDSSFL